MAKARTKALEVDLLIWSPDENSGMRQYDLNIGGMRIAIYPHDPD